MRYVPGYVKEAAAHAGKKFNRSDNTQLHGVHVRRRRLPEDVIEALDKAFEDSKGEKTFFRL